VEHLTNANQNNLPEVRDHLKGIMDKKNEEAKKLAMRKKQEALAKKKAMMSKNKFIDMVNKMPSEQEVGPKCVVCQEGYSKRPTEILGFYVFQRRQKVQEITSTQHLSTFTGVSTVTYFRCIHFTCH